MSDTTKNIICPACNSEMIKYNVPETNFSIDICEKCGGIFFDNRELEKFINTNQDIDSIIENYKEKDFIEVDSDKVRICPVCNVKMVKMGSRTNTEIDVCNTCGGKFLDKDEIKNLKSRLSANDYDKEVENALKTYMPNNVSNSKGRQLFEDLARKFIV